MNENNLKLRDPNNKYYKYAIKQEIARGVAASSAPESYPPDVDLHPLINAYRNKKHFGIDSNKEDGWYQFIETKLGHIKHGLTLGSGGGRHERNLTEIGVVDHWTSIDLVENPLDNFTNKNRNSFLFGDLNFIELPENKFDLVYCHGVLHHIINLEHLLYQIYKALKPDGSLVVFEYVGEVKWQWEDIKSDLIKNAIESKFTGIKFHRKSLSEMNNRPLESIRSSEIPDLIHELFTVKYESYWNNLLYPFINSVSVPIKNKGREFIDLLISFAIDIEEENQENSKLVKTEMNGIYSKKPDIDKIYIIPWKEKEIKNLLGPKIVKDIIRRILNKVNKLFNKNYCNLGCVVKRNID